LVTLPSFFLERNPTAAAGKPTCGILAGRSFGLNQAALNDIQKGQHNEYESDNDQNMNPTACLRKTRADVPAEKAQRPQNN